MGAQATKEEQEQEKNPQSQNKNGQQINGALKKTDHNHEDSKKKEEKKGKNRESFNYTFTLNGKSLKENETHKTTEEDTISDMLQSTEIREGNTPQLSEEEEYLDNLILDKGDISLADLGDSMVGESGIQKKLTLKKAATLKKQSTLKKKVDQKQVIHVFDIQPARNYFEPHFSKQFTRQQSQKHYNKVVTLFVPE